MTVTAWSGSEIELSQQTFGPWVLGWLRFVLGRGRGARW